MKLLFVVALLWSANIFSQDNRPVTMAEVKKLLAEERAAMEKERLNHWSNKLSIRGYAQLRYNRLGETNKDLVCSGCDKSIGDRQGLFLRRARLIFSGEVHERLFVYIQPDYASDATNQNYFQMRDAYFDLSLDPKREWRIRSGLSKIPYGFANLQSSSNRPTLDRDDSVNSAVPNERDINVSLMWATEEARERFQDLANSRLKGSGDYGLVAVGVFNGQTLNRAEQNNDLHRFIRVTYPFKLPSGQFIEASLQAYEGKFNVTSASKDFVDSRQAISFILYPQPFGFQAEYNVGRGPKFSPEDNKIKNDDLKGGYAQISYTIDYKQHRFFPFLRYQDAVGSRKIENAALIQTREWELGTEWQPIPAFELTAAYAVSDRLYQNTATNRSHEKGNLIRLQAQFNY